MLRNLLINRLDRLTHEAATALREGADKATTARLVEDFAAAEQALFAHEVDIGQAGPRAPLPEMWRGFGTWEG